MVTATAMVAFAANSVLARIALEGRHIDAAGYTAVRLISGTALLLALVSVQRAGRLGDRLSAPRPWWAASLLFGYAAGFSFAYLRLGAATGALVLFGSVQLAILAVALARGERPGAHAWVGLALAAGGLVYLASPGLAAPDSTGVILMVAAGVCWAGYTLVGRNVTDAVGATAGNFLRASPIALVLATVVALLGSTHVDRVGMALAVTSGALASGLGYVLWYAAVPFLTRTQAGVVQLSPAPLAALGGLVWIGEPITTRVVIASAMILGGVWLAVVAPSRLRAG